MNSALLEEKWISQSLEEFFQAQASILDCFGSRSEWWEVVKGRLIRLFKGLARRKHIGRDRAYQGLRRKLEILVSQGGDQGEITEIKRLLRQYQYDRLSSLILERDYGKYHSPDPYQNCKQGVSLKLVTGLRDSSGSVVKSRPGILSIAREFYADLLGEKPLDQTQMESFLVSTPGLDAMAVSGMDLTGDITAEEVARAIGSLAPKKTPGPDGLTAEFYKAFKSFLAPQLAEVFNSCLAEGALPSSMRQSAVILLSKGKDPSAIENWRPISLLNVDRKILAKILFWRLSQAAFLLLSRHQHCSIVGKSTFSAVLAVREVLEWCRAEGRGKYLLALDQAKAFDRVNHKYLWRLLEVYGLQGRFINWLRTLYEGAESFMLINGWVDQPFEVSSGVRQGCPLSPLLYVFAIDPFVRRLESSTLSGVPLGIQGVPPLKVVAYADDVSVVVSETDEAKEVVSVIAQYESASGSKINPDKCEIFWMGEDGESFELPDSLPVPQEKIKVLGIEFGPGDYGHRNWVSRLDIAQAKVVRWKGWHLTFRERIDLIKTHLVPVMLYVSYVAILPTSLYTRIFKLFFQMLWGNSLNPVRRNVTYLARRKGGLGMVNPIVFFTLLFIKHNFGSMLAEDPPDWVSIFQGWLRPFLMNWQSGGQVKSLRGCRGRLPTYVAPSLRILRLWRLGVEDIKSVPRGVLQDQVIESRYHASLALRDCPGTIMEVGLRLLNSTRVPNRFWDIAWLSFHGRLYVRGNLKFVELANRGCPREECGGVEETMDHFLLGCPFNIEVYRQVGRALGIPPLERLGYAEWVYGAFKDRQGYNLCTLFLVSLVVRYYTWQARCQVSIRQKVLPVPVVVFDILGEVGKIRDLERRRMGRGAWVLAWQNIKPP